MRKRFLIALVLGFALVATACGDSADETTPPETSPPATQETTPETTPPETTPPETTPPETTPPETTPPDTFEEGPLGAVRLGPGDPIEIRTALAISGDVAFLGIPSQRAVELAVEDYGDIMDHPVELGTAEDDLCSNEGGQAAGQAVVAQENVIGVIATSCSGAAVAMAPLISAAGMVMISPSNTSPSLTSDLQGNANADYNPGYYRTAHNDLYQGEAAARFAFEELGVTTAAAIHDGDPYTNGLAQAFADAFEALGGEIGVFTAVNKGDTDMVPVLTEVAAESPELIFFPIFMPEGGFIVQQVSGVPGLEDTILFGADGLLVDNFMELPEAEGVYFSGPDLRFGENASSTGVSADQFLATYEERFGEAPSAAFWAHSYDATIMLLEAIEDVMVQDGDDWVIDRQALRDRLNETTDFPGIIGTINCDDFGDCGSQRISVVLHEDSSDVEAGKQNVVYSFAPGE